jgi:integrase
MVRHRQSQSPASLPPPPIRRRGGGHGEADVRTFDAFVENVYLPHVQLRKRSWRVDERIARQYLSPAFGACGLAGMDRCEVEVWLQALSVRGLAPATCNRILAVLKSICALALAHGALPPGQSPCAGVPSFKVHTQRERYLAPDEAGRLMRALEESPRPEAVALRLLLLTGARKSEILKARWENVRLDQRLLTVPLSKSNKPRHIPLSDEAAAIIRSIRREPGCPWLFPGHAPDKPLSDIYLFWNELRRKLGLADVRIHDLRHTFASFLVNAGHSLYEVQKLLGHSDPRTTMRYAHLGQASLVAAAQTVSVCLTRPGRESGKPPGTPPRGAYGGNSRASPPAAW